MPSPSSRATKSPAKARLTTPPKPNAKKLASPQSRSKSPAKAPKGAASPAAAAPSAAPPAAEATKPAPVLPRWNNVALMVLGLLLSLSVSMVVALGGPYSAVAAVQRAVGMPSSPRGTGVVSADLLKKRKRGPKPPVAAASPKPKLPPPLPSPLPPSPPPKLSSKTGSKKEAGPMAIARVKSDKPKKGTTPVAFAKEVLTTIRNRMIKRT